MHKKVLIAAGGTGGHIFPALAIAARLQRYGVKILYVGNCNSLEEELAAKAGLDFTAIDVQKLYRNFTFSHIKFPFKLVKSIITSKKIIKDFKPDVFVGTGGFVCGPVGYAAHLLKVPIFLQEQNSYPGLTTRILSKFAEKIFLGNAGAEKYLPKQKLHYSGNPINISVAEETGKLDFKKTGLSADKPKLFLYGGSQGSLILNKAFLPIIDQILNEGIEVIWQIGRYSFEEFYPKVKDKPGVFVFDFTHEMGKVLNSADFVIARGGALSLAEIETKKLPAIIVPLPSAAGNHQYFNAMELVSRNVAILLEQKALTPSVLFDKITELKEKYKTMEDSFNESLHLNATDVILQIVLRNLDKEISC